MVFNNCLIILYRQNMGIFIAIFKIEHSLHVYIVIGKEIKHP